MKAIENESLMGKKGRDREKGKGGKRWRAHNTPPGTRDKRERFCSIVVENFYI